MLQRHEQRSQLQLRATLLVTLSALITLWGLLAIYRTLALSGGWESFLARQSLWALAAWTSFFIVSRIRFEKLMQFALILAGIGALALLLLPLAGVRINGMNGWYHFKFITVQPSELTKAFYILGLIKILHLKNLPQLARFGAALAVIMAFAVLLIIQPDLGTAAIYLAGGFGALYFGRVKLKYLLLTAAAALFSATAAIAVHPYMINRLKHFLMPTLSPTGGGWHLRQFAIAVARGEWFGVKGDMAVWSNSFLPLAHNDSVFAAQCEILGFCGGFILLMLFAGFFHQAFTLGAWRRNHLRRSVIDAMTFMIFAQTMLHIGVNLNLLPPTGVTLPLISYGGSSLVGTMLMLGIIISAARKDNPPPAAPDNSKDS